MFSGRFGRGGSRLRGGFVGVSDGGWGRHQGLGFRASGFKSLGFVGFLGFQVLRVLGLDSGVLG